VQDESLLEQMALARTIASLGLSARNAAGLKVRQPLARVLVYAGGQRNLRDELVEIITDELNVKSFEFVEQASRLVTYRVMPDNKSLGPRFGALFPKVRSALSAMDPARVAESISAGIPLAVEVDGQTVDLAPSEIIVTTQPAEGLAVASDKLATVAVDATLTPELKAEGLAREVVRRIQDMRKKAGFDIADRITTFYQCGSELAAVFAQWQAYIMSETLTTRLVMEAAPAQAYNETHNLDGQELILGVLRN
jgi:isoleucyl-tRNA synthetase